MTGTTHINDSLGIKFDDHPDTLSPGTVGDAISRHLMNMSYVTWGLILLLMASAFLLVRKTKASLAITLMVLVIHWTCCLFVAILGILGFAAYEVAPTSPSTQKAALLRLSLATLFFLSAPFSSYLLINKDYLLAWRISLISIIVFICWLLLPTLLYD